MFCMSIRFRGWCRWFMDRTSRRNHIALSRFTFGCSTYCQRSFSLLFRNPSSCGLGMVPLWLGVNEGQFRGTLLRAQPYECLFGKKHWWVAAWILALFLPQRAHPRVMTYWIMALILLTVLHSGWPERPSVFLSKQDNISRLVLYYSGSLPLLSLSHTHHTHTRTHRRQENEPCCPLAPLTHRVQVIREYSWHRSLTAFYQFWQFFLGKQTECWFSSSSWFGWLKPWLTLTDMLLCKLAWSPKLSLPQTLLIPETCCVFMSSHTPIVALVNSVPFSPRSLALRCVSSVPCPFYTQNLFITLIN